MAIDDWFDPVDIYSFDDWVIDLPYPGGAWRTKDGQWIDVHRMEDRHIKNCIKLLNNEDINFDCHAEEWIKRFNQELEWRKNERAKNINSPIY